MRKRKVLIVVLAVAIVVLTIDTIRMKPHRSATGKPLEKQGFWSGLIAQGDVQRVPDGKGKQMATISVILASLALLSAACTLYGCRRTRNNMLHLKRDMLTPDEKRHLFDGATEVSSLRRQVEQLQRSLDMQSQKLRLSGNQLDAKVTTVEGELKELRLLSSQLKDKITKVEKACSGLGEMSENLETLKEFKDGVERLHSRIRQALNGNSVGIKLAHGVR